ncbi:MAG TPA: 2Fe-2S iron-sulfur cluster-binding protein, partial [Acidimicrobiales bacterium]|nr:2Fe-2S iron-sulfur cluster-binding protein [Acidimicrobiales bacterium]
MTVSDDNPQATLKVTIDGQQVMASPGELIISATDRAGVHVPRFCYHPRMKPVGMCRMCLVEVSGPRGMSLQPACFLPVSDGMEVVTDSDRVKKAQDGVLEFLLINHPLDCPVCDKGGECPLQDQTLAYGPGESRFIERKRHWAKPIELSDLILLDRERCIQCARCTRFAEEVAGDPLIDFMSRGDEIEVNIFPEERFNSYFSGNTVQICPVGALTATPYRFAARPWDLEQVESTCTSCSVGCRVVVQSSADSIIRYLGVDSEPVNRGWLCDKGRFDFEAHKAENRVTNPMIRKDGQLVETSWLEAIGSVASHISEALEKSGPASVGVIGGARLANEDAYAWAKLAKAVIGTDCVDAQLDDGLPAEYLLGLPRASFDDACSAPLVLLAGPDLREEAPILFLRLKEACQSGAIKIVELTTVPSSI